MVSFIKAWNSPLFSELQPLDVGCDLFNVVCQMPMKPFPSWLESEKAVSGRKKTLGKRIEWKIFIPCIGVERGAWISLPISTWMHLIPEDNSSARLFLSFVSDFQPNLHIRIHTWYAWALVQLRKSLQTSALQELIVKLLFLIYIYRDYTCKSNITYKHEMSIMPTHLVKSCKYKTIT